MGNAAVIRWHGLAPEDFNLWVRNLKIEWLIPAFPFLPFVSSFNAYLFSIPPQETEIGLLQLWITVIKWWLGMTWILPDGGCMNHSVVFLKCLLAVAHPHFSVLMMSPACIILTVEPVLYRSCFEKQRNSKWEGTLASRNSFCFWLLKWLEAQFIVSQELGTWK